VPVPGKADDRGCRAGNHHDADDPGREPPAALTPARLFDQVLGFR
jgi:hypothetical protein